MKSIVFQLLLQPLLILLHQTKCKSFGNICSVLRMFIYSIVYPIMYAQFNHYDIVSLASSLVHHGKHLCIKETHRLWHTCAFQQAGIKRNLFKEKKSSFDSLRSAKKRHPKHKLTLLLVKCSLTYFLFDILLVHYHKSQVNGSKPPIEFSRRSVIHTTNDIDLEFDFSTSILTVNGNVQFGWPKKKAPKKETTRTQLAKFMHIVLSKLCDCEKDVVKLRAILIVPIRSDVVIFTMNESYLNRIKCSFFDSFSPFIFFSLFLAMFSDFSCVF